MVYADFDKAIAGLPESYGKDENIHPTKGAALAMKARFALYMGDYEIAAQAAKACMDLKLYSLEPDYAKLFKQSTKLNDEKVFVIPRSIENEVMLDSWIVKNGLPRNAEDMAHTIPHGTSWPHISVLTGYLLTNHRCLILASLSRTVTRVVQ